MKEMERPELFKNDDIMDAVFSPDIEEEQAVEPIATAEEPQKLGPQVEDISSYSGDTVDLDSFVNDTITDSLEPKKAPLFIRILKYFIPWKGDAVKEIIRKCIFIIALVAFIISGVYLINYYYTGIRTNNDLEDVRTSYYADLKEFGKDKNTDGTYKRFDALYKMNKDIIGWVSIDDTKIDYPVFQTDNNDFYIDHDMYKTENRYGAVFADYNATITTAGNNRNVVLYGHNMIDGSMFTQLLDYKNLEFYREHPIVAFDTIYGEAQYKVFAVYIVNADEKDDDGYVFNYRRPAFQTSEAFNNFIAETRARSIIDTTEAVTLEPTDELLTLSTCSYEFDNARTVVVARKLRAGESAHVDVSNARKNKTPLYPQAYYDVFGGKKPQLDFTLDNNAEDEKSEVLSEVLDMFKGDNDETYTSDDIISDEELEAMGEIEYVTLGNYVGLSLGEAILRTNDIGINVDIEYDGDKKIKENNVLSQSLVEGTSLKKGSTITLKVSGVPIKITVPDFIGMKLSKAKEKASKKGLTVCTITVASKEKKNTVLLQSVKPGTKTEDRAIVLYISNGINKVPDVVGLKVKAAEKLLKEEGFKVQVKYHETVNKKQIGKVASQSIDAGQAEKLGTLVIIYAGKKSSGNTVDDQPYIESETTSSKDESSSGSSSNKKPKPSSSAASGSASSPSSSLPSSEIVSSEAIESGTVSGAESEAESTPEINTSTSVSSTSSETSSTTSEAETF